MDAGHALDESTQYLTFTLAGEEYGVGLLKVREIIRYDGVLTAVPAMPPWVRGVTNLRGSVVPVVDLAILFGIPSRAITNRTCVVVMDVVVHGESVVMGVIADTVSEVRSLAPSDIESPPCFGTRIRGDMLTGLGKIGERFILMLDIDRMVSAQARV
jgi:purine-binding chemotaxis protein CheW